MALWMWPSGHGPNGGVCKKRINARRGKAPEEVADSGNGWGVMLLRERLAAWEKKSNVT